MVAPTEAELLIMHVRNNHSAHHQEPSVHSHAVYFQRPTLHLTAREKRAREIERGRKRLTHCSHRRDDRGPVEVEHSKVGLTILRPESPCAALFIKSCKDNSENPSRGPGEPVAE